MAKTYDNQPTARERVDARRRGKAGKPDRIERSRSGPTVRSAVGRIAERLNTPKRPVARQRKPPRRAPGQAAMPGPKQVAVSWFASGRIMSALLLLGSLLALIYAFTNARFTVQHVEVAGAEVLKQDAVIDLADAYGQSIWYVDSGAIREKLQANAYVETASVGVGFPDTLRIEVVERRPELRWSSGGQHFNVDMSGRVLGVADASGSITNTLVIDDRSARPLKPNDSIDRDALSLGSALALRLTPETGVKPISISWTEDRGIFVVAPDNKTIIFGRSERLDEKLIVLDRLLKDGTAFTFLDLRPKTPYYRNEG